jgi:hypothetical protein
MTVHILFQHSIDIVNGTFQVDTTMIILDLNAIAIVDNYFDNRPDIVVQM